MRISDWSSDVCSSDLSRAQVRSYGGCGKRLRILGFVRRGCGGRRVAQVVFGVVLPGVALRRRRPAGNRQRAAVGCGHHRAVEGEQVAADVVRGRSPRSEEHTSELQSLMRISYAVFCLKKKKKK